MLRFGKVSKIKGEKDEKGNLKSYETKDAKQVQKEYETKVNSLLKYCMEFKTALNGLASKDRILPLTAKDIKNCFNNSFKDYFKKFSKKFGLFSRTTKVLKGMDKELEKLGNLKLISKGAIAKIRDAFEYRREMPKDGLIKRSAIDDKAVYGFFNGTLPGIIENLVSNGQKAEEKEEDKIKFIEESLKNAKFENRLVTLQNKIQEIKDDLEEIKEKQAEYEVDEKSKKKFQKNNEFIDEIGKSVETINVGIESISRCLELSNKKKLVKNGESKIEKDILYQKKQIRLVKNVADRYDEKLKKLKSDVKKATEKSNEIIKKLKVQEKAFSLNDGTLTIEGQQGAKNYWSDYLEYPSKYTKKVKTVIMNNVGTISDFYNKKKGICSNFKNLTSVTARSLEYKIDNYSFYNCSKLSSFNSSENNFYNIPAKVKQINSYAFYGAGKDVPNGFSANVEAGIINYCSFANSGLKKINLPNATAILSNAFSGCTKLTEVNLGQSGVMVMKNAFDDKKELTIYVKNETLQKKLKEQFFEVKVEVVEQL